MLALEVWAEQRGAITVAALVENRKLIALEIDNENLKPAAGEILSGKITALQPRQRSAEVDLGPHGLAFLDLGKRTLNSGDAVVVEWLNPAHDGKLQTVRLSNAKPQTQPNAIARLIAGKTIALGRVNNVTLQAQLGPKAELVKAPFELIDIEAQLAALLNKRVELPHAGSLIIEPTEALTVIDVNGGGAGAAINPIAMAEVARQLRLRNLGGMILVDAVGGRDTKLVDELRRLTADDTCRVEVLGITRLGLIEITRQRLGYTLAQQLQGFGVAL